MTTMTTNATRLGTRTPTSTNAFVPSPFLPFNTTNQSILRTGHGDNFGITATRTSTMKMKKRGPTTIVRVSPFPVDPWSPSVDSQSIASLLFAVSLFPYLGFLYFITRSRTAPPLTLFGFYFLLAFVGATRWQALHLAVANSFYLHRSNFAADQLLSLYSFPIISSHAFSVPAGIYAKVQYGTSLSNVDWLHGGAESLLTLTNLFIVLGLRRALRRAKDEEERRANASPNEKKSSV